MNRATLSIAIIFVLLAAVVYFVESPGRILGTSDAMVNEENATPFAVAQTTTTTHYDADGAVNYTFNADRLEHYRNEDSVGVYTLIEAPTLTLYETPEPWLIQAKKGKLTSQNRNIELWSDVIVQQTDEHGITTTITTEKLLIDPLKKLASTEQPVTISSDNVIINGTGMNASLADKKLKLLSEVHGKYDPS